MNPVFWKGRKVLITGHTGFKGSWLSLWLQRMGADIVGYSLLPPTNPNLFEIATVAKKMTSIEGDIRNPEFVNETFLKYQPEIVFHLAAQPLVRYSYEAPRETYETNVIGTLNILEGIRHCGSVRSAVLVTTDKCYENKEWDWGYRENDPMGGFDLYSSSKGCAELLIASYRNSFFHKKNYSNHMTSIASARAGNVIGGGDWAKDRLIPDIINSFINNNTVDIRSPNAIRPWQHVLDPLAGYLLLAERLFNDQGQYAEGWNFGPNYADCKSVSWIADKITDLWPGSPSWNVVGGEHPHEANFLKLDCSKAQHQLGWSPNWNINDALEKTIEWYIAYSQNMNMKDLTIDQIEKYEQAILPSI